MKIFFPLLYRKNVFRLIIIENWLLIVIILFHKLFFCKFLPKWKNNIGL